MATEPQEDEYCICSDCGDRVDPNDDVDSDGWTLCCMASLLTLGGPEDGEDLQFSD